MQKLKKFFMIMLAIPIVMLCSCSGKTGKIDVSYYFADEVTCTYFSSDTTRSLTLSEITNKKIDTELLSNYCSLTLEEVTDVSRTYHLYIDYIVFYVYTNESSDYDFNITITITNVVNEEDIGTETTETTYSETYSSRPKAKKSMKFVVEVDKVVSTALGCTIMFDIINSEVYNTTETVTFKWLMYGLEIHAEPRAYND